LKHESDIYFQPFDLRFAAAGSKDTSVQTNGDGVGEEKRAMTMHGSLSLMTRFQLNTGGALFGNEVTGIM
jgi:hypothetical protein